ncbi:alanine/glycine:cation symporter family protein [Ohessyouella blattaphilus]|uniref:Sodium:alanine symporter family protein n=1 Tax=Ohessyouella blattaphilus TaxID=2949333 RepID=A0ABT1EDI8_9FIRM|nr:sodium:alanine symporter family protein [Ohessyouella blattaphilus]MCP1108765.1 sodium:alanine symporter family protein [Ohessyouella blattaphilus]MCR8562159.1 sodium:alanine symporter family protein [Ohessyouella blattaphilus]
MAAVEKFFGALNGFLWDYILIILLVGTGVWFTLNLKFIQVRKFTEGFKRTFGNMFKKQGDAGKDGMSSFQALATAIAAQVGTGNIAGAATAIAVGGAGAIFWMWISAFFGMATIYAEATMAQKYKTKDENGQVTGGPVYYIKAAFKGTFGKILAGCFAVFIIFALGFMGNAVQSNSIGAAFQQAFGINPIIIGVIVAVLAFIVFAGGIKRIAQVTELLVPIMAIFYILGTLIVIIMNIGELPRVLSDIVVGGFNPQAVAGGVAGATIKLAVQKGVARGLFSNEAGMGSTPHAHAVAKVKHPSEQGYVAMMGVFIDTFVILNLTAFVILITGVLTPDGSLTGTALSQAAFSATFGKAGEIFLAVCLFFFAFSTIIGWYFFGEANVKYLFGEKALKVYAVLVCVCIVIGSALKVELVWTMADCFNGLMVIPNLIGLWALTGVVKQIDKESNQFGIKTK